MQLLGIYIIDGNEKVLKNLKPKEDSNKEKCWYPFGDIENCHELFKNYDEQKYENFLQKIKENQSFNQFLYKLEENTKQPQPAVNINCIVGKNGSGKTSLLTIFYRIINNLSCEIKSHLSKYNADYHPIWATGFNAELYYEMNGEDGSEKSSAIYCIKVSNNDSYRVVGKDETYDQQIKLDDPKLKRSVQLLKVVDNKVEDIITKKIEELQKANVEIDEPFLEFIGQNLFYTVGTNYSLYSNSVVTDEWDDNEEKWLGNIYHKNDGYFTPVVLVPYKNEWTTINTKKELSLAKERISTLSLLVYFQNDEDFIENLVPESINYELIEKKLYKGKEYSFPDYIHEKTLDTIDEYYENLEKENPFTHLFNSIDCDSFRNLQEMIKSLWTCMYFSEKEQTNYINILNNDDLFVSIINNTLAYLTYKTIKICLYYDIYKNEFPEEYEKDIFKTFLEKPEECKKIIRNIIVNLFTKNFPLNFTNLKIKQCITFLENLKFYLVDNKSKISVDRFINTFLEKKEDYQGRDKLTYDYIFENLPPAFFNKQTYFRKKNEDANSSENKKVTISSMSSGESQLLNSMSYAVYHIKNAISSTIKYKNINLIFDEAELYYHPEYQRVFIKDLLGIISRSNLGLDQNNNEGVKCINITIVTHSPFILSDIPNENLLCLKDGKADNDVLAKTLGANFYDLMQNQFFMESSIGAVAENILNTILNDFNTINNPDVNKESKKNIKIKYFTTNNKTLNSYTTFVNNLADDYLRTTFQNMISIIRGKDFIGRRQQELNSKIKELENLKRKQKNEQNKI